MRKTPMLSPKRLRGCNPLRTVCFYRSVQELHRHLSLSRWGECYDLFRLCSPPQHLPY
eukprot:gene761-404_t